MALSLRGVITPHRKSTANMPPQKLPAPASVTIPMSMHIGKPAAVCVRVGDIVKIGDKIGEADGFVSSDIFASVSGKVSKISEILLSNGSLSQAVVIESDGEMAVSENICPPTITNKEEFISAVRACGLVGLGGAGFPTHVKFSVNDDVNIEEFIINGAECEPYITSDSVVMTERADDIKTAIEAAQKFLGVKKVIIGIEKNKPQAIAEMKKTASEMSGVEVKVLKSLYPQGGEKVLIYHTTGKVVKMGALPISVGCVVCNSTTMATLGAYLKTGVPLVSKCITVDGSAVAEPKNVIAPIGTSLSDIFSFCGGFKEEPRKILYGGPMMGISVPSIEAPVLKNTNAVLAFGEKEATLPKTTSCIRCGACVNHCPFGINPYAIANAFKVGDLDETEKLGVNLCMECGCCSFICPANRPLVQTNRLAKAALREIAAKEKKEEKK